MDGYTFNHYASALGVKDGSLKVPDLGGTLYYSHLRVYDLSGLCDKTVARTLVRDPAAFHDYVFEVAKPTFVRIHGNCTYFCNFDADPRFRRDYVAIREWLDPFVKEHYGRVAYSGEYVRKDAIGVDPGKLGEIKRLAGSGVRSD